MLIAFIGCSCVGKSTIMNLLHKNRGFIYAKNIVTRHSRFGEYHKTTISEDDFDNAIINNELILENRHFNFKYSYLRSDIEQAISDLNNYWMIDFGIENINQLNNFDNTYKIIIIPESIEFLKENVIKSGRQERLDEIILSYENFYANLNEVFNNELNSLVIKNKKNDLGGVTFKIIRHLVNSTNCYISGSPLFKDERLGLILVNLQSLNPASNGLEAYKLLSNAINEFEDQIWGANNYFPPRSFLHGNKTDRMYTIFTESFFEVPGYTGVSLLLSRRELIFISRYGAIEIQLKDDEDKYGDNIHFDSRKRNVIFKKNDSTDDGVWVDKNK